MKKRKITDNIPLKIMSVAIAVVLWLIVVNIDNPTGTNYYTLNDVELINKEYVESSDTIGKMCMPEQNQDSIKDHVADDLRIVVSRIFARDSFVNRTVHRVVEYLLDASLRGIAALHVACQLVHYVYNGIF